MYKKMPRRACTVGHFLGCALWHTFLWKFFFMRRKRFRIQIGHRFNFLYVTVEG